MRLNKRLSLLMRAGRWSLGAWAVVVWLLPVECGLGANENAGYLTLWIRRWDPATPPGREPLPAQDFSDVALRRYREALESDVQQFQRGMAERAQSGRDWEGGLGVSEEEARRGEEAVELYRKLCFWKWVGREGLPACEVLPTSTVRPFKLDLKTSGARLPPGLGWTGRYSIARSPHFQITTQASTRVASEVAKLCEETYAIWQQLYFPMWADPLKLYTAIQQNQPLALPMQSPMQVVLFRDRDSYLQHLTAIEPAAAVSTGYYSPRLRRIYCYWEAATSEATLRHELTHQFFQEASALQVGEPNQLPSDTWIIEGLALHMEAAVIARHQRYQQVIFGGWDAARLQPARYRRLHDQSWVNWEDFRQARHESFRSNPELRMWYSQAAGLAHLWMDSGSEQRAVFYRYLRGVFEGQPQPGILGGWNEDDKVREAYDRFLLDRPREQGWRLSSPAIRELVLSRCQVDSDILLGWPEVHRRLDWLDVSFTDVDDRVFTQPALTEGQRPWDIQRLNLENTRISDAALPVLARMPRLEELDLSHCQVSDQGVASLAGQRSLKILWLTGNRGVTDAALKSLASLPRLQQVELSGTSVSEAGWQALLRQSPKLRRQP